MRLDRWWSGSSQRFRSRWQGRTRHWNLNEEVRTREMPKNLHFKSPRGLPRNHLRVNNRHTTTLTTPSIHFQSARVFCHHRAGPDIGHNMSCRALDGCLGVRDAIVQLLLLLPLIYCSINKLLSRKTYLLDVSCTLHCVSHDSAHF